MSDDHSPPDFIDTADFPLDESALKHVPVPTLAIDPQPPGAGVTGATLFAEARPLGLETSRDYPVEDGSILEGTPRGRSTTDPQPEPVGPLKAALAAGRDHSRPLYRRQSTVAAAVLLVLAGIVGITFPWSEINFDSEVEAGAVPAPASGTPDGNSDAGVDSLGSEGFFQRSKSDATGPDAAREADDQAAQTAATEDDQESEDEAEDPSSTSDSSLEDEQNDGDTEDEGEPESTPPTEQPETSVFVGPGVGVCLTPGAQTPLCQTTTTAATPPTPSPTQRPTGPIVVSTEATTATTEAQTTTTSRTTTTARPTTQQATTLRPTTSATTETTQRPTTTSAPTTTDPSSTGGTTTTPESTTSSPPVSSDPKPTTTETTVSPTTDPSVPEEDDGTTPTAVNCDGDDDELPAPPSTDPCQPEEGPE